MNMNPGMMELTPDQMEEVNGGSDYDVLHNMRGAIKTRCSLLKSRGKTMQELRILCIWSTVPLSAGRNWTP